MSDNKMSADIFNGDVWHEWLQKILLWADDYLFTRDTFIEISLILIAVGLSFWAYAFFNIFFIAVLLHYDKFQLALAIRRIVGEKQEPASAV